MTTQPATKTANPGPVGLLAFGMTTILLNLHNMGFFPITSVILAMGIFYGGIAQIIVGLLEYKRGNTFGFTAFTSYGSFWLVLVFTLIAPKWGFTEVTSHGFMAWFLFLWGAFSLFMFIGTLNKGKVLQFVFASLTVLFFLLAVRDWTGSVTVGTIAGFVGLICGGSAFYLGVAEVLDDARGKKILKY